MLNIYSEALTQLDLDTHAAAMSPAVQPQVRYQRAAQSQTQHDTLAFGPQSQRLILSGEGHRKQANMTQRPTTPRFPCTPPYVVYPRNTYNRFILIKIV